MRNIRNIGYRLLILFLSISLLSHAQNTATLSISGEVLTPLELKKEDLASYKQQTYKTKGKEGKEHEYKGVALVEVLEKAGVTLGGKLRGENLAKAVLVKAADGYEVVYSLPELDPEFTTNVVLLVTEKDGAPLPTGEGPFRLIALQDKKQARWIREIRAIKVVFVKD
ncbi:molybdopterin-dependent oxidoreductase [Emticicia sp. BO119]|uniref:molybdopterin-dependent oxidoreductase n=1 Tax=Emticicia sp. BO119 TaxID=2757768 RepID=UPI0015F00C5D|nr:molybdopterin-dependent oxidoreductase [Emticicia sp. BO119]MBA4851330.1 molybdopterin-dependent oxidoreductase [Emticicia sp. BO119]